MKLNFIKFWYVFSFLILIFGCKQSETIDDFTTEILFIKGGSQLIQGKQYEFVYDLKEFKNQKFFLDAIFAFTDGKILYQTFRLLPKGSNKFSCNIKIPPNCSYAFFTLSDTIGPLSTCEPFTYKFEIYKSKNLIEYGGVELVFRRLNPDKYLDFFYKFRSSNPNNISIYATRWVYEIDNKIENWDSIYNQIKFLEGKYSNRPELPLLQLIAYTYLQRRDGIQKSLRNILEKVEFLQELNFPQLGGVVANILRINAEKEPKLIKDCFNKLLKYNPYSQFALTCLNHNVLIKRNLVDSNIAIGVVNKMLSFNKSLKLALTLQKARILTFCFNDSLKIVENLINEILNYYKLCSVSDSLYENGFDFAHIFRNQIGLFPTVVGNWARFTKKYMEGVQYLKETLPLIPSTHQIRGFVCYDIAQLYFDLGFRDSSLKYYIYAYKLIPKDAEYYKDKAKEKISELISNHSKSSFEKVISKYLPRLQYVDKYSPNIVFNDGEVFKMSLPGQNKLIVFFDLNCGSCLEFFESIEKNIDIIKSKRIKILLVTPNDYEKVKENPKYYRYYSIFQTGFIKNWQDLVDYFHVPRLYPIIIAVGKNNEIIFRTDGLPNKPLDWSSLFKD